MDAWLQFEDFIDPARCHQATGQDEEDNPHQEEADDNLHGIGHEDNHFAEEANFIK